MTAKEFDRTKWVKGMSATMYDGTKGKIEAIDSGLRNVFLVGRNWAWGYRAIKELHYPKKLKPTTNTRRTP